MVFDILLFILRSVEKIKVSLKSDKNTLHEDVCTHAIVKVKVIPEQATKAKKGSRSIAVLFL